jgi:hypothetical protein
MASDPPDSNAVLERISKLEKQNQRLKKFNIAMVIFLSAVLLMGQAAPPPKVLEAQRFVLKDSEGNVRGWMGTIGNGSELTLGNVNAQPMMKMIVSTEASDLHFWSSENHLYGRWAKFQFRRCKGILNDRWIGST